MTPIIAAFALEGVETPWLWLAGGAVGAAFLFWTYYGIYRRSGKNLAWVLMGLRGAGLVALVLTLAKPVWTRTTEHTEPGRVAVVVDNSVSMTLPSAGQARYDRARSAAAAIRQAFAQKHGDLMVIDLFDLAGQHVDELPASPTLERTDLARPIRDAVAKSKSKPLAGVVLISDGADHTGHKEFQDLAGVPVPVYTLGFTGDTAPDALDLVVRKPQVPLRAMVNNEVKVDVPVAKVGNAAAVEVTVSLRRGDEVLATQNLRVPAGASEQTASLKFTPKSPGLFHYTVRAESPVGEPDMVNNAAGFDLSIDGEPIRIVYLDGSLRWESRYLLAHLRDDPDIELSSSVRIVNPDRASNRKEALTPERLAKADLVILGDMDGKFLGDPEYAALLQWLEGKNHALLLLGGYRSFGPAGWATTPLKKVLPVNLAEGEPYQREGRFVIAFTDDGRRHPIFELSGDREKDLKDWDENGVLDGLSLVGREKPGATVLAVHPGLTVGDKPAIVAAFQPFGEGGKVMVLTGDTTWKWSRLPRLIGRPDTMYGRFWSQTVRWLVNRNLDDRRPLMALSTDQPSCEVGKLVTVKVVRSAPPGGSVANTEAAVEVRDAVGKSVPVPVRANSANPDEFVGTFTPPAGGRYEVLASLSADTKLLANQRAEMFVQSSALELKTPGVNESALPNIASVTRGKYFDVSEAAKLADEIPFKERKTVQEDRTEFWNSRWLFFAFLGAITVEWFMRRRNHMV